MNSRRLLIIDDTHADAVALATALSREGYATRRVTSSEEALRRVGGAHTPDLVLWSATADESCAQAMGALRKRAEPSFLPIVLLSPQPDVEARVAGLRAGADDVVGKPWRADEILARVAALLRIKSRQDELALAKLELERQSVTDPLTGLFNRRYFQYRLEQELERGRRYGAPVSLLLIDLDHFKRVNDRYGHSAGDEALRTTAGLLGGTLRRLDVCTRWGGEEFAIIMPNTGPEGAVVVARRLLRTLRAKALIAAAPIDAPMAKPEPIRITASLGLASLPSGCAGSAETLVKRADAAMYRAKAEGRDCFRVAPEPAPVSREAAATRGIAQIVSALAPFAAP